MQIKRLRLSGFKSFVDPADLRIEPGLTGVVGPNGCGKSNLLEALRWTMGETSARSMRGAGMDDVIFAGTATRPQRQFAEVSLLAEIAGEETEVVRRIERGAGSAYRIDGRDVRAKDVALLFADAATGAHSPALVSQNRIGAVISARPADRRAMLEDAAGISGLHVRRRDAEQKLRATEANLEKLDALIADQGARVAALRRQARQAERYRTLSAQVRIAEARLIYARWRDAATAADAAKRDAAACDARVAATDEARRHAIAAQGVATTHLADARAAALAARERAGEAAHALATLRAEKTSADRRLADLVAARAQVDTDRAREGTLANDAEAALRRLAEAVAAHDAAIAAGVATAPALDTALADAERTSRDAEVALAQAIARQASERAEMRVADAALTAARTRLDRAAREAAAAAHALAALGDAAPIEAERVAAIAVRTAAAAARDDATATLAIADRDDRAAQALREAAQTARAAARADLAALDGEAAALERALRSDGRDRVLDRLVVAPGYERAVAAALGDDLEVGLEPADTYWAGADVFRDDPAAPAPSLAGKDATPLAAHVTAPPQLARRLAQVFVIDTDDDRALATGQRLVTPAGAMRRWDGFVARRTGTAAAERLERRNRLAEIVAERPAAQSIAAAADDALADADAAIAAAREAAHTATATLKNSDAAIRAALQREDRATAALDRLAGQRADLAARAARTAADRDEAAAERDAAQAAVAALPDTSAAIGEVARSQHAADVARTAVATARAARVALDHRLSGERERLAAARAEIASWRARAGDAAKRIASLARREADLTRQVTDIADRPAALDTAIAVAATDHDAARAAAAADADAERAAEATLRGVDGTARTTGEALAQAREARAAAAARAENHDLRRIEMGRVSGERFECPAPVLPTKVGFDSTTVRTPADESSALDRLTAERERIGPVNLVAERELAELEAASTGTAAERDELAQAVARLRGSIGTLNREGRQRLLAAFEAVDAHFRRLFATLFQGGQAHLALVDSDDPLEAGLEIMAQPPGKRLQSLTLLSGGEQALTAVALIFGLFLTNPAPICVLDEVDAPLDDANIERFCDLLDTMTRETTTRYLIVTHNAVTMSRMHRLFGVTMIERGVSRLVSVDLRSAESLLAAE